MKPEQIYINLKELADKLQVEVKERNLRNAGVHVNSGLCKVKGDYLYIMDKNIPIHRKIKLLASCLKRMPADEVFILPAVRKYLK